MTLSAPLIDQTTFKLLARRLHKKLAATSSPLSLSQLHEAMAQSLGHRNFHDAQLAWQMSQNPPTTVSSNAVNSNTFSPIHACAPADVVDNPVDKLTHQTAQERVRAFWAVLRCFSYNDFMHARSLPSVKTDVFADLDNSQDEEDGAQISHKQMVFVPEDVQRLEQEVEYVLRSPNPHAFEQWALNNINTLWKMTDQRWADKCGVLANALAHNHTQAVQWLKNQGHTINYGSAAHFSLHCKSDHHTTPTHDGESPETLQRIWAEVPSADILEDLDNRRYVLRFLPPTVLSTLIARVWHDAAGTAKETQLAALVLQLIVYDKKYDLLPLAQKHLSSSSSENVDTHPHKMALAGILASRGQTKELEQWLLHTVPESDAYPPWDIVRHAVVSKNTNTLQVCLRHAPMDIHVAAHAYACVTKNTKVAQWCKEQNIVLDNTAIQAIVVPHLADLWADIRVHAKEKSFSALEKHWIHAMDTVWAPPSSAAPLAQLAFVDPCARAPYDPTHAHFSCVEYLAHTIVSNNVAAPHGFPKEILRHLVEKHHLPLNVPNPTTLFEKCVAQDGVASVRHLVPLGGDIHACSGGALAVLKHVFAQRPWSWTHAQRKEGLGCMKEDRCWNAAAVQAVHEIHRLEPKADVWQAALGEVHCVDQLETMQAMGYKATAQTIDRWLDRLMLPNTQKDNLWVSAFEALWFCALAHNINLSERAGLLHKAVALGDKHIRITELLLNAGMSPNAPNSEGHTVWDMADVRMTQWLHNASARPRPKAP